jgi:hypothetical protein
VTGHEEKNVMESNRPVNRLALRQTFAPVRQLLLAFVLLILPACEAKRYERIPLYPVRGKVLFDGKPAAGAEVRFNPLRPAEKKEFYPVAKVEADGSFTLTTFENKDGAPPGEYLVTIRWEDISSKQDPPPDRLKGRYTDPKKSPWRVQVREEANDLEPFQLHK